MPIDKEQLAELLGELGGRIKDILVTSGKAFLDEKVVQGKDFLKEEVADAAYWTVQLAKASDDAQAASCQAQLDLVKNRTINKLWSAAVDASKETRSTLKMVAETVFEYAVKILPKILGIVAIP